MRETIAAVHTYLDTVYRHAFDHAPYTGWHWSPLPGNRVRGLMKTCVEVQCEPPASFPFFAYQLVSPVIPNTAEAKQRVGLCLGQSLARQLASYFDGAWHYWPQAKTMRKFLALTRVLFPVGEGMDRPVLTVEMILGKPFRDIVHLARVHTLVHGRCAVTPAAWAEIIWRLVPASRPPADATELVLYPWHDDPNPQPVTIVQVGQSGGRQRA